MMADENPGRGLPADIIQGIHSKPHVTLVSLLPTDHTVGQRIDDDQLRLERKDLGEEARDSIWVEEIDRLDPEVQLSGVQAMLRAPGRDPLLVVFGVLGGEVDDGRKLSNAERNVEEDMGLARAWAPKKLADLVQRQH